MQLPKKLQAKIVQTYGALGEDWLAQLPDIVRSCSDKWNLRDLVLVKDLSINAVFLGESSRFGKVVLKTGVDISSEMEVLPRFGVSDICRCYAMDESLGALLIERILPGNNLLTVCSQEERIWVAADLMTRLSTSIGDARGLPTCSQWVKKAFDRARSEGFVDSTMSYLIKVAEKAFHEIESLDRPLMLLHGDLHHENILQSSNGQWKAIDPKGVIGASCMESGRFIINQLGYVPGHEKLRSLEVMATMIGEKLDESPEVIAYCGFVEHVLAICWMYEDNDDPQDIKHNISSCQVYSELLEANFLP